MTSGDLGTSDGPGAPWDFGLSGDSALPSDLGLLLPMRGVARETGDAAVLAAMLEAETAPARAQAALGRILSETAAASTVAARTAAFDLPGLAGRACSGGKPVIPLMDDLREAAQQEKR